MGGHYVLEEFSIATEIALDERCGGDGAIIYYKARVLTLKARELGLRNVQTWSSRDFSKVSSALDEGTVILLSLGAPSNY